MNWYVMLQGGQVILIKGPVVRLEVERRAKKLVKDYQGNGFKDYTYALVEKAKLVLIGDHTWIEKLSQGHR